MTTILAEKEGRETVEGTLAALRFEARSTPVFDAHGIEVKGYQRIWRPDTGKTLAIMTDSYKLVQHHEAMAPAIENLGTMGWKVARSHIEREGASAFVELESRDNSIKVVGEKVGMRILMRNTYDGTSTLRLSFGALVLACSNGAIVPGRGSVGFEAAHVGGIQERLGMLTAKVRKIEDLLGKRMMEEYSQLDSPVSPEVGREIVRRVLGERNMDKPLVYWRNGKGRDGSASAWNLYNGITQYLTHDFTGGWGRRERKNSTALDLIAQFVREGRLPDEKEIAEN